MTHRIGGHVAVLELYRRPISGTLTPSTLFVIVLFLVIFVGIGVGLVRYIFGKTGRLSGVAPHTGRSTVASE